MRTCSLIMVKTETEFALSTFTFLLVVIRHAVIVILTTIHG